MMSGRLDRCGVRQQLWCRPCPPHHNTPVVTTPHCQPAARQHNCRSTLKQSVVGSAKANQDDRTRNKTWDESYNTSNQLNTIGKNKSLSWVFSPFAGKSSTYLIKWKMQKMQKTTFCIFSNIVARTFHWTEPGVVPGPGMLAGCARGEAGVALIRPKSDSAAAGWPQIKE